MEKDIIDIVTEKEFIELTSSERDELKEFCANEDEYNHLRDVMLGVNSLTFETVKPKKETKQKLDDLFDQTYPKVAPVWYMSILAVVVPKDKAFMHQPLLKVAAVGLFFLLVYPIFNQDVVPQKTQVAELESLAEESDGATEAENKLEDNTSTEADELVADVTANDQPLIEEGSDLYLGGANTRLTSADLNDEIITSSVDVPGDFEELTIAQPAMSAAATGSSASLPGVNHPDGVFNADDGAVAASFSTSAAETPDVFDLLTTTF